jgi:hypothetical protein
MRLVAPYRLDLCVAFMNLDGAVEPRRSLSAGDLWLGLRLLVGRWGASLLGLSFRATCRLVRGLARIGVLIAARRGVGVALTASAFAVTAVTLITTTLIVVTGRCGCFGTGFDGGLQPHWRHRQRGVRISAKPHGQGHCGQQQGYNRQHRHQPAEALL